MPNFSDYKRKFHEYKICIIVPSYNNAGSIKQVITDVLQYTGQVIVVNDGSTDDTSRLLQSYEHLDVITLTKNMGKGYALRKGFELAHSKGYDYALTIDSDGQHYPDDIPLFIECFEKNQDALIIGSRNFNQDGVPGKSKFGNRFSNFWFRVETGIKLPDTQSGFRLYPIKLYKNTNFFTRKFEFELEILVRTAWKGIQIIPVPVKVYYSPDDERVSHFRPLTDFVRISILNTILVFISLLYIKPRSHYKYLKRNSAKEILKEVFFKHNETDFKVSAAVGFGIFMGIVPIWGFQMIAAAFFAHWLRLNKPLVIFASNISIPPMIPFILYLSYKTGGLVLRDNVQLNLETFSNLKSQIASGEFYDAMTVLGYSIFQYIIGSFAFGLVCGLLFGLIVYILILYYRAIRR
jgi:glycosyltransferase involved in cell wall biosynthesis